jgi:hypothetical protein
LAETLNKAPAIVEKIVGLTVDFVFNPAAFSFDENGFGMI